MGKDIITIKDGSWRLVCNPPYRDISGVVWRTIIGKSNLPDGDYIYGEDVTLSASNSEDGFSLGEFILIKIPKIAIAITTHNRRPTALHAVHQWREMLPDNAKLYIVDDASNMPFPNADYRFETNVGISVAKNKCLEICDSADHIFICDDDVFPITKDWYLPYINSPYNHLSFTKNRAVVETGEDYVSYEVPSGLMLYFKPICLEVVGGWDTAYKGYSYEHVDISNRIYNAGLTPHRYMDVPNSDQLFYSYDFDKGIESSVGHGIRAQWIRKNHAYFMANKDSKEFKDYKSGRDLITPPDTDFGHSI